MSDAGRWGQSECGSAQILKREVLLTADVLGWFVGH